MNNVIGAGKYAGFTLVEVVVSIAVLGVILTIGVPSFYGFVKNNRMATAVNDLNGTLQYARAEAVRRGGGVRVSAISGEINNGLRVWVDSGSPGLLEGEDLRVFRPGFSDHYLSAKEGGEDRQNLDFSFNARGFASGLGDNLTIEVCDDRMGNHGRKITLLTSGSVRLSVDFICGERG